MDINLPVEAEIEAKVFRARKDKPKYLPKFLWRYGKKKRLWFAGEWEDLGLISTTETGIK